MMFKVENKNNRLMWQSHIKLISYKVNNENVRCVDNNLVFSFTSDV